MLVVIKRSDGSGAISFDASVSETHSKRSTITEFPVEQGAAVADHVRTTPFTVTINGIVGAAPLDSGNGLPENADRVQIAYADLLAFQDDGELLELVTSLATYKSMVIESTSVARDAQNGRVLNMNITLRQIKTSSSSQIDLPTPKAPRGRSTQKDGRATGTEVAIPNVSLLRTAQQNAAKLAGGDAFFNIIERATAN